MNESQYSVGQWVTSSFNTDLSIQFKKLKEEVNELEEALENKNNEAALEETADVIIVCFGIAFLLGGSVFRAINQKMRVNRNRKWKITKNGIVHHV